MSDPLDIPLQRLAGELERGATRTRTEASDQQEIDYDDLLEDDEFEAKVERGSGRSRPQERRETDVTKEVLEALNARPGHLFIKVHQGAFAGSGQPDLDGCVYGRTVKIEMKAVADKKHRPTDKQHRALLQWQRVGALVGVAASLEQVDQILSHLHDPTYRYDGQFGAPAPGAPPEPED